MSAPRAYQRSSSTYCISGMLFLLALADLFIGSATAALAQGPVINAGGVVNGVTNAAPIVAGGIASIYGTNLASGTANYNGVQPIPTSLGGTSVKIGGFSAPLYFASATQLSVQVPWEVAGMGSASVTVTTAAGTSAAANVNLTAFAPVVFSTGSQGIILNPNGSLNAGNNPAPQGTTIQIAATDLGPVSNQPADGNGPSGVSSVINAVTVTIGGVAATVTSATLCGPTTGCASPDASYLINVVVPAAAPIGNAQPVIVTQGVTPSNTVTMAVASSTLTITNGNSFGTFPLGPIQIALQASGGTGKGYTWQLVSGALPTGLIIRSDGFPNYFPAGTSAGIIGVATATAYSPPASFILQVTDSANHTATNAFTLGIIPLAITDPNQLADGFLGATYSYQPTFMNNTGTVTWSVSPNTLPSGLSLNTTTGLITGTPNGTPGNIGFNLAATDSTGTVNRFVDIDIFGVGISTPGDLGNYTVGSTVNAAITAAGGTAPYTFSVGGLPQGLSFTPPTGNQNFGTITGTITGNNGTFRFNAGVTDHNGYSFNKNFVITIIQTPTMPGINVANPIETSTVGESRNFPLNVNGGKSPYSWSISSGSLPPGMVMMTGSFPSNFNVGPDDAVITGAPTAVGDATFTVTVKDSSSPQITVSIPITISVRGIDINYPNSNPTRGAPYSAYIQPFGAVTSWPPTSSSWTILSGALPAGLNLNGATGVISGTPTENGNFNVFMQIQAGTATVLRYIGFNVGSPTSPLININGTLPDGIINSPYNYFVNWCCDSNGVTFFPVGAKPSWMTIGNNGQLTGTPNASGQSTLDLEAADNLNVNDFGIRHFTLDISPMTPNTAVPNGTVNVAYPGATLTATGGTGALTWAQTPGSQFPPGLNFGSNGAITGTPTSAGSFNVNYVVSDTAGNSFHGGFNIQIYPQGALPPPTFNFGSNFGVWPIGETQFGLTANGGDGITYTWSLVNGSLPTGLSLRTDLPFPSYIPANAQAEIAGVATAPGTYNFTLSVTSGGQTSYIYCTWKITGLTNKDGGLPQAFVGVQYSYTFTALNAANNGANLTWTQNNGTLPNGLTFVNGVLSGTPQQAGNFNFGFLLSDGVDTVGRGSGINVAQLHFTTDGNLGNVNQNGVVSVSLGASGGSGSYTFTGGVPQGLTLSSQGVISGTINTGAGLQPFNITVTDTNNTQLSYNQQFSINVIGSPALLPAINLQSLIYSPIVSYGVNMSRTAGVQNGGAAPFTWTVTGLPPGLSARPYNLAGTEITPGNVEIWGVPTAFGTYQVTYTVTDHNNQSATLTYPMTVSALTVDGNNYPPNGTLNVAYSAKLRVLGGIPPYTVSQYNSLLNPLPEGVTLNTSTFTLGGTPIEDGGFGPIFQFTDSSNNPPSNSLLMLAGFNIASGTNPQITINNYFNLGTAIANSNYNQNLFACCTPTNQYTWSLAGGSLPTGIGLSATGVLSGTPTVAGLSTFLVKAADSTNPSNAGYKQFAILITTATFSSPYGLPYGNVNSQYQNSPSGYQIAASGGNGPLTFSLGPEGPLPLGMTLASNGRLSGTPTQSGQFLFNVIVSDNSGPTNLAYFSLAVYPAGVSPAIAITTGPNLGTYSIGEIQAQLVATAASGNGPFTWSVTGGALPPGLSLRTDNPGFFSANASAGILGVATTPNATPYQFTLTVTSNGQSASQNFTMTISGLTTSENNYLRLPDAFVGSTYTHALTIVDTNPNPGAITWTPGSNIPPGLSLNGSGVLSGTPSQAGFYNFTFTMKDSVGTVTVGLGLSVNTVQVTSAGVLPNGTQGQAYPGATITASGGTPPYTFSLGGGLPNGLSIDSNTGIISGTVNTGPGRYSFNAIATDHNGVFYSKNTALVIIGVPPGEATVQPYGNFDDCSFGIGCSRGIGVINGGVPPFNWNVSGLPPGMSFRTGYGVTSSGITPTDVELIGAPTALGTFSVQVSVTDGNNKSATQSFPLKVTALFVDGSDYLPGGTRGGAYSKLLRVLGGSPASGNPLYGAQINQGVLPEGLGLSGMTVSGTPVENGNFGPQILYTDHAGPTANTLHITNYFNIGDGTSTIAANTYGFGSAGSTTDIIGYYTTGSTVNFQLNACCAPSYNWSVTGGTLPPGLNVAPNGAISGTATTAGNYFFTVQVADSTNSSNTGVRQYFIGVTPLNLTVNLPYGNVGTPYPGSITPTIGGSTVALAPGFYMPPGLTLNPTGAITGTPTERGQVNFTVQVTDGAGDQLFRSFSIQIFDVGEFPPLFLGTGPTLGPDPPGTHTNQLTASGGNPPYHYSFSPGAQGIPNYRVQDGGQLPTNFTVPTAPATSGGLLGISNYTLPSPTSYPSSIRVTDNSGNTFDRAITFINSSLTVLNSNNPPSAAVGSAYSYTFVPYGGSGSYTWSAAGLPNGISIGSSTGTISGTPTASGSPFVTITVTDTNGTAEPFGYTLNIYPFAITTGQVLPQGTVGVNYSQTLTAPNCGSNCTWSILNGGLPGGLTLSSAGVISGKPTGFSNSTFLVQASGSNGSSQREFALLVPFATPQPLFITSNPNLYYSTVGNGYSTSLAVQGGTPPYTWSLSAGSLPPGISLLTPGETLAFNFLPGFSYLYGKPMQTGSYPFTLKVTDGASNTTTQAFTWTVTTLNFNIGTFPPGGSAGTYGPLVPTPTYGVAYSQQLLVIGGSGNYTSWTTPLASNPLPPGLNLNGSTGVVSGTPAATGSFSSFIQVTDDQQNTHGQFITFNVASPTGTTINFGTGPNLGNFASGGTNVFNLNPSSGTGPYTITALTALPPGCALETGSSLLSNSNGSYDLVCAYLAAGTYTFSLEATDSAGNIGVRQMTINVLPQQLFTTTALANGSVGTAYSQQLLAWDNAGTVSWSITAGSALPPGMTLTGATLGGTPSTAGSYAFTLTATDSSTNLGINYGFNITISTITITNPAIIPSQAEFLVPFSYQFTATGGGGTKTWTVSNIPSGLTLNSTTGVLSGMVTTTGLFPMTVTVTDGASTVTKSCVLFAYYTTPALLTYFPTLVPDARVGQSYSFAFNNISGGTAPYTWAAVNPSSLPPGLSLISGAALPPNFTPGTTLLAGEPTTKGTYTFDLILSDSLQPTPRTSRITFTVNVALIAIEPGTLPNATINVAYSRQLTAVGGTGPYTFTYIPALTGPDLPMFPPGIIPTGTGLISGTPTTTGTYSFYVTATDSLGNHYRNLNSITVTNANGLMIASNPIPSGLLHAGYGFHNLQYNTNTSGSFNWTVQAGTFPPGLTMDSGGNIYGASTTPGVYTYTIRATDNTNSSNFADRQYFSEVYPMTFSPGNLVPPPATVGTPYSYTFKVVGGTGPYTFSTAPLNQPPAGLSLSSAGVLSGTPTQSGAFYFSIIVTDSSNPVHTAWLNSNQFSVLQPGQQVPIAGDTGGVPSASVGAPFAIGGGNSSWFGVPPISITVDSGTPPPGIKLIPGTNGLSDFAGGIPTTPGSYNPVLLLTDSKGQIGRTWVTFSVTPLVVAPFNTPNGSVGTAYASPALAISGETPPYTITLSPGSDMPAGLSMSSNGALSGTPIAPGEFGINILVTDAAQPTPNQFFTNYRVTIDQSGTSPGISIGQGVPIQITYVLTAPVQPIPVNIATTSGTPAFTAMIAGIPALSLSATSGTAPTNLTLNLNTAGLVAGTYSGVVAVQAPGTFNVDDYLPVELTVTNPPPCTYSLTPASGAFANGTLGQVQGSFDVNTSPLCSWTATTGDGFVTVSPDSASGLGPGTVGFSLSTNNNAASRTGSISVNGQSYSITQFGSSCALTISPTSAVATAAGGTAAVNVTTNLSSCAWTATGLTPNPPGGGTGSGTVTFTIPPTSSTTTQMLSATVQLTAGGAPSTFTVTQTGAACTVGLSASSIDIPNSGGSGQVNVTIPAGCTYNTVNPPNWISITNNPSGSGPGPVTLSYTVLNNSLTVPRTGTLNIGGQIYTITQDATPCTVTVNPANSGSPFNAGGGAGTLAVTTNVAGCTWTATSPQPWVTVSPSFGTGNGSVNVTATSNASSTTPRATTLTVGGQSVGVTQGGTTCMYMLGSANATVPFGGGTGSVTVTSPGACSWSSSPDASAPWLTISSSGSGGTSNVVFVAAANATSSPRSGTLTIAGQPFTVTEAAGPCNYTLSATSTSMGSAGGPGQFTFSTATQGCSTSALSFANWLGVSTSSSPDGTSGTVSFTATANTAGTTRTGTIQFGGQTYTVSQTGAACAFSLNSYGLLLPQAGGIGSVLGSPSALGCLPGAPGVDQPSIVNLGTVSGPLNNIYTLPFTVVSYNATVGGVRRMVITFAGQLFIIKQTSW